MNSPTWRLARKPAALRPFEAVAGEVEQAARQRLRKAAEKEFGSAIQQKYPVLWQHR